MRRLLCLLLLFIAADAHAAIRYLSPSGSNAVDGQTTGTPWLTFAYAMTNTACGDTLVLLDGVYGDGTSTGKLSIVSRTCTAGNEFTVTTLNQRRAKINDNGSGFAVYIANSAYIIIDGILAKSTDNASSTSGTGQPIYINGSDHITIQNSVSSNPNRYGNTQAIAIVDSRDVLSEDNEIYIFHRHGVMGYGSQRVTVRRLYVNPRGGRIAGGYNAAAGLGAADAAFSMYACIDCIAENIIADGTTHPLYLVEMNAAFYYNIPMQGAKVLGSICYRCNYGNVIYPNSRTAADLNHTPQNITIRDVAIVDWGGTANGIRCSDCVGATIDHVSVLGTGTGTFGIVAEDTATGGTVAQNSVAITNALVYSVSGTGLKVTGATTWSGDRIYSYSNGTAFNPAVPSNWTNTLTTNPGMGTCKVWIPDGAAAKGAGTGGSDIGATILYRYVDGVLTGTPLWNQTTGEFPHGSDDLDGLNNVVNQSLKSFHTRINVNTNGCAFPSSYGSGGGGGSGTVIMGTTAISGDGTTSLSWAHALASSQDRLMVCVALYHSGANVGSVTAVDASGQSLSLIKRQVTSPAYRAVELWSVASPTAGDRTITVSTTGSVSGMIGRSIEFDTTSGLNTAVGATALSATPSVTAPTNANELLVDCVAYSKAVTIAAGADQTELPLMSHSAQSLALYQTTQDGSNGGVMSESLGGNNYWAQVAVSLIASPSDPPITTGLTLTQYRMECGRGSESAACALGAINAPVSISTGGMVRIRAEVSSVSAASGAFGVQWFCRKNADSYVRALDTYGANTFRLHGPDVDATIPSSLAATTQQLNSGNFVTGGVLRDEASSLVVSPMASSQKTELVTMIQMNGTVGDTVQCRPYLDNGSPLDAYTVTPTFTLVAPSASGGF